MVRIINAFRGESPIGNVLTQLGQQLFGDQAGASINREQAYALQRSNVETDNLARLAASGGLETLSPTGQAMLIASGYDPNDLGRVGALGAATQFGARDPRTTNWSAGLGEYGNTAEAFDLDLAEVARNNNLQSGDRRYNVDQNVAEDARQFDQTPQAAMVNGQPAFVPRVGAFEPGVGPVLNASEAQAMKFLEMFPALDPLEQRVGVGAAPSLDQTRANEATRILGTPGGLPGADPNTQAFLGADVATGSQTPRMYRTPDGREGTTLDGGLTDAHSGETLPQGTLAWSTTVQAASPGDVGGVTTPLYRTLYAQEDALALGDALLEAANAAPPEAFGAAGAFAGFLRGGINTVANLAGFFGADINTETMQAWVQQNSPGISPAAVELLFQPGANETQTLAGIYTYQVAAVLSGQTGQDLSDKDVQAAMRYVGDPRAWGIDRGTFIANIQRTQGLIQQAIARTQARLGQPARGAAAPAPTGTPTTGEALPAGWTQRPDGTMVTPDGIEIRVGSP